jgi:fructokinase
MAHTIVGLGEALWDILPSGKHLGGAPLNFVYIASLLGEDAIVATRVGKDSFGNEIRRELGARNLDPSGIQIDPILPTGTVNVTFKNDQPQYEIRQPVAWDALEWSPEWKEIAARADAVCFGTLAQRASKSRKTIENFLENTSSHCLRVLDINLRRPFYSPELIESSLFRTNVLKLNEVELPEVAAMFGLNRETTEAEIQAVLRKFGIRVGLVTCGEHGAIAAKDDRVVKHPGFSVKVRDTIGAGDAFTAAATHCLLAGMDLERTLTVANRWASWVASQPGGMPPLPEETRREMLALTHSAQESGSAQTRKSI